MIVLKKNATTPCASAARRIAGDIGFDVGGLRRRSR